MNTRKPPPTVTPEPAPPAHAPTGVSPLMPLVLLSAAENSVSVATVKTFREDVHTLETSMEPYVHPILPGYESRYNHVSGARWNVVTMVAELLRKHPNLDPGLSPADILGGRDAADAMGLAADDMQLLATELSETERVDRAVVWSVCSEVMSTARGKCKRNKPLAADLANIKAELAIGKRTELAAKAAAKADAAVLKAAQKLAKAQQKAAAKAEAKARTDASHAAAHPADVVIVPTPTTPTR